MRSADSMQCHDLADWSGGKSSDSGPRHASSIAEFLSQTMNMKWISDQKRDAAFLTQYDETLVIGTTRYGWIELNDSPAIVENVLWKQESELPFELIETIHSITSFTISLFHEPFLAFRVQFQWCRELCVVHQTTICSVVITFSHFMRHDCFCTHRTTPLSFRKQPDYGYNRIVTHNMGARKSDQVFPPWSFRPASTQRRWISSSISRFARSWFAFANHLHQPKFNRTRNCREFTNLHLQKVI
jgi:hypothetical protein